MAKLVKLLVGKINDGRNSKVMAVIAPEGSSFIYSYRG